MPGKTRSKGHSAKARKTARRSAKAESLVERLLGEVVPDVTAPSAGITYAALSEPTQPAEVPSPLARLNTGSGAHFIMSHRRAGRFGAEAQMRSRAMMESTFARAFSASVDVVSDTAPFSETARRITHFRAEPEEVRAKTASLPADVLVEPVIPHFPAWTMPLSFRWLGNNMGDRLEASAAGDWGMPPSAAYRPLWGMPPFGISPLWTMPLRGSIPFKNPMSGTGQLLRLRIASGNTPLANVSATLFLRGPGGTTIPLREQTNTTGVVQFSFSPNFQAIAAFIDPYARYWPRILRGPVDRQDVDLEKLPMSGPIEWWHRISGVSSSKAAGGGVNVGVVDTGCGPHPNLAHAQNIGAFINGDYLPAGGSDVDRHGTHVSGIIGARPNGPGEYAGLAPAALLFAARVFPDADTGANQGDIADAIDRLSRENQADIINLSLGSASGSTIERDAIQDALERGTLCVCAAGNDGRSPISYPARFPECVAVSALGINGWGASGSPTAANYPNEPDKYGEDNLFLAEFSNFGPEIACVAPGNGIISTVPAIAGHPAPYAALDGTSMAAPVVSGVLARILSDDPDYLAMPRNALRAARARAKLKASCRDLGLAAAYQGRGNPRV